MHREPHFHADFISYISPNRFSLGGQASVYTASVCFHYVTVYVTYDRMWRIDITLGARVYFYSYVFLASAASEQRATPRQQGAKRREKNNS